MSSKDFSSLIIKVYILILVSVVSFTFGLTLNNSDVTTEQDSVYVFEIPVVHIMTEETKLGVTSQYDTSFKSYMDYRTITDENSKQYDLQSVAYTDSDGLRKIGDSYLVALGSYYAEECGEKFVVEFDNGERISVIVGDIKSDVHTDSTNMYTKISEDSVNVIEFIVDVDYISDNNKILGSIETDIISGNVVEIYKYTHKIIQQ